MQYERDIEDQVVNLLKIHLNHPLTLLQFSELTGDSLIQLLNKIIHSIDPSQFENSNTETREETVERISEFLRILKYPFPMDPVEWDAAFIRTDHTILHPVILFLLKDFETLKKKAYIAKYAEEVFVPDEIRVEESIQSLLNQHAELRDKFSELYDENDKLGETSIDLLKQKIKEMEQDKGGITHKINQFKRQLQNVPNVDQYLAIISKTRQESEQELRLSKDFEKLTDEKENLDRRQNVVSENIKTFVSRLNDKKSKLLSEISIAKSQSSASGEDKNLIVIQQQIINASKRLDQKNQQLQAIQKQRAEEESKFQERQSQGIIEVPDGKKFTQYFQMLQTKNANFKTLQQEISVFKRDLVNLIRTEEILKQQYGNVQKELDRLEKTNQVTGFRQLQKTIEATSVAKSSLDESKIETLEELSQLESEIQRQILGRQEELRPFVAKIQEKRKQKAQVETKFLQAKNRYNTAVSEYDANCLELEEESKKYRADIFSAQSKYYTCQGLSQIHERQVKRVQDEQSSVDHGNRISKQIKTYSEFFHKESRRLRKENKELKEKKSQIGTDSGTQLKQLEMFQSLRRLLQVKEESQRQMIQEKKKDYVNIQPGNAEIIVFDQEEN